MLRAKLVGVLLGLSVVAVMASGCSSEEGLRITRLEPKQGNYLGGDSVIIHGNGFQAEGARDVIVYFGDKKGKVLAFEGDSKLKVSAPAGEQGKTVDVTLIFGDARRFTYPTAYTYIAPGSIKVDDLVGAGKDEDSK